MKIISTQDTNIHKGLVIKKYIKGRLTYGVDIMGQHTGRMSLCRPWLLLLLPGGVAVDIEQGTVVLCILQAYFQLWDRVVFSSSLRQHHQSGRGTASDCQWTAVPISWARRIYK